MKYRIEISSVAEAEADNAFRWIAQVVSAEKARQWYEGLLRGIESLSEMPKRCSLARENEYLVKKFGNYSTVKGEIHTVFFLQSWQVKKYLQFAFSTSDTLHKKHLVKLKRKLTKPNYFLQMCCKKPFLGITNA